MTKKSSLFLNYFCALILAVIPFLYNTAHYSSPGELPKLLGSGYLILTLSLVFLFQLFNSPIIEIKWHTSLTLLSFIFLSSLISYLFSIDHYLSFWGIKELPSDSLSSIILFYIFSLIVFQCINNFSDVKKYSFSLLFVLTVESLVGILQRYHFDPFTISEQKGIYGSLGLTVAFSSVLGALSPLILNIFLFSRNRVLKYLSFLLIFIFNTALFFSASRMPIFTSFLITFLMGFYFLYKKPTAHSYRRIAMLIFVIICSITFFKFEPPQLELNQKLNSNSISKALNSRLLVWKNGITAWTRNPILGTGPQTFIIVQKPLQSVEMNQYEYWNTGWIKAHNHIIDTLVNTGLIGFLAQLLILFFMTKTSLKIFYKPALSEEETYAFCFYLGYLFLFIANLTCFNFITTQVYFYVFPVLFSACLIHNTEVKIIKFEIAGRLRTLLLIILAMPLLLLVFKFYNYSQADIYYHKARFEQEKRNDYLNALDLIYKSIDYNDADPNAYCRMASIITGMLSNNRVASLNQSANSNIKILSQSEKTIALQKIDDLLNSCLTLGKDQFNLYLLSANLYGSLFLDAYIDETKALKGFNKLTELFPSNPESYLSIGVINLKMNKTSDFINSMRKAINLKSDYLPPYLELLHYYYSLKDFSSVTKLAKEVDAIIFNNDQYIGFLNDFVEQAHTNNDIENEMYFKDILMKKKDSIKN